MLEYNEKVYKKISAAGTAGIVLGIIGIMTGVVVGTMSIIFGAMILDIRKHLID
ncbi:hypothetical protein [Anaerotalea alkaliphila]|uniref:hypothetical protein n=1 Tax=Anaerotalea alkaliphila TaxID=2662126 RepID=UPI001BA57E13|nr:hypothetical protein [Anaerotalea alkaliphila]